MHPQPAIFALGATEHCYLELDVLEGRDNELIASLSAASGRDAVAPGVGVVVGFRPELWSVAGVGGNPGGAASLLEVRGPEVVMPATQHDAWVWLAGASRSAVFDGAVALSGRLEGVAAVATEQVGWSYRDGRDLTGFVDGTENPTPLEAAGVAVAGPGPGQGGSVLLYQLWRHHDSWSRLDRTAQERVIGRTKPDSVELDGAVMPADSHVSRNVVEQDGAELRIYRRNVAFGGPGEHGTVFVGFCAERRPLQVMLERMAGVPDGIRDALTRYTEAVSGAYYVCPSVEALAGFVPGS